MGRLPFDIASATADTTISNNSQLSAQKSLAISAGRDATLKSGSKVVAANDLTIAATRNATVDTAGSIKVTTDATVTAGELAYLKDSTQPITIGKQLIIEGKQATVLHSTANANNGIYIKSQGKATTITNSTLNSDKGAVTAIANQAVLTVNNLTTNANSTILAAGSNVGITASTLKADNIVVESGATTTINGLTTSAKNIAQVGGTSISSKENTSVSNSTLNSTGNTVMRSDKSLTLTNNDIQSQGIVIKTNTANTLKNAAGISNTFGEGDITLTKNQLLTNGINDNSNGIIIDAANHLNVIDSQTKSSGSTSLKSGNLMRVNSSTLDADKHLNINSGNQLIFNGARTVNSNTALTHTVDSTTLKAGQIVSIDSKAAQSYQNTGVTGGAVLINSENSIGFNTSTNINATGSTKLATSKEKLLDGKAVNTLNGDLAIASSTGNLTIAPKNITLNSTGDLSLASRGGKLHLKGYAGTQGIGSEQVVKLNTSGDINLSGKEVVIEASDLASKANGITITATDGSVELKGVKNSFQNYISPHKINTLKQQITAINNELKEYSSHKNVFINEANIIFSMHESVRINNINYYYYFLNMYQQLIISDEYKSALPFKDRINSLNNYLNDLSLVLETSTRASTGYEHKTATLTAGKDINITSKQGVLIEGADITSTNGGISILAEGNLPSFNIIQEEVKAVPGMGYRFDAYVAAGVGHIAPFAHFKNYTTAQQYLDLGYDAVGIYGEKLQDIDYKKEVFNDSIRITGLADIYQQGNMSNGTVTGPNYSYHQLINQPKLTAKGDIKISAQGKLAKASDTHDATLKTHTTNNAVILNSADIVSTNGNVRIDAALGDINLESAQAAFMDGSQTTTTKRKWYGKKKTTTTTKTSNNANAITTDIQANNISLTADGNINIYASELVAAPTGSINISAGKLLNLYAVDEVNESSTDVQKRSSWLGIRYNKDHTNDTRQELSQLPAKLIGDKANTASGGSTLLQGTVFNTLKPADIKVGVGAYADNAATVILAPITNQITTTHNQERESTVWMKTVDQGSVVTTASLPKFNQAPTITSPNGVIVAVPVEVTVDANNKAKTDIQKSPAELGKLALELSKQSGYEYLATLDKSNDINWVQVDLIQKNWDYTQEGLTPGAAALIAIAVTMATGGTGALSAASFGITSAAGGAAFSSLASQAAVMLINNKGDIGATLKQLASSATIRSVATSALTAGINAQLNIPTMSTKFGNNLVKGVTDGFTSAFVDAAVNGTSLEKALENGLRNSMVDALAASTFTYGTKGIDSDTAGEFARNLAHKLAAGSVGCLSAKAKNQSCDAGALGAIVGEMVGDYMVELGAEGELSSARILEINNTARLAAGSVALLVGVDVNVAANSASEAVKNNSTFFDPTNFGVPSSAVSKGLYCGTQPNARACMGIDQYNAASVYDKYFDKAIKLHRTHNDMTLFSIDVGTISYTYILNNKNGNLYAPELFEVTTSSTILSGGFTVNFGNIAGSSNNSALTVDNVIKGSSVGFQNCGRVACGGVVLTQAGDRVYTYGVNAGSGGASVTGGTMKLIGKLPTSELNKLLSSK